jgi:tetraacyldisaccharide 4'-kinase
MESRYRATKPESPRIHIPSRSISVRIRSCGQPFWTVAWENPPDHELADRPVAAFCGIGNPEGFRRTIGPLCGRLLDLRAFPDHHGYTAADVESLAAWSRGLGAELVLTTQKDLVKLRGARLGRAPLRALRIGLEIAAGADVMEGALARLLRGSLPE